MQRSASLRIDRHSAGTADRPMPAPAHETENIVRIPVQPQWIVEANVPSGVPAIRLSDEGREALCALARRMRIFANG